MLKKTIKYTDYNGVEREEDFYFNLSKAECIELQFSKDGGLDHLLNKIVKEMKVGEIINIMKEIVMKAYGEKSPDGRRFIKSKELTESFEQTEAYSELFVELMDANKAADFIQGVLPADLDRIADEIEKQKEDA